ncbi:hypothetical protein [Embleya sp. NBC_00896]|uniref:hypothetical protein n=1 Tax=Embleya sp. NBC_00896 TaxID=2975961 RepID=UPI00386D22E4|nr:hypothetical protein OG928_14835 [Embleya sp. NBC_00896]
MAFRKETMQSQIGAVIAAGNPTDRPIVTMFMQSGPHPATFAMFGAVGGLIGAALIDTYFFTVTEQAVLIHNASGMSSRPKSLAYAFPHAEAGARIVDLKIAKAWSSLYFHLPEKQKPTRFRFARPWRPDAEWAATFLTNARMAGGAHYPPPPPSAPMYG